MVQMRLGSQCSFNAPAVAEKPIVQRSVWLSESGGPIAQRHTETVKCNNAIASIVSVLFRICRPSAVIWRIRTVVVDAVNCVARRRPRPHIRPESRKRSAPALAHDNATCAIVRIATTVRVITALFHAVPCSIERIVRLAVALAPENPFRITAHESHSFINQGQRVSQTRPLSCFLYELRKILHPLRADGNSASAEFWITRVLRIQASLFNRPPHCVFAGMSSAVFGPFHLTNYIRREAL